MSSASTGNEVYVTSTNPHFNMRTSLHRLRNRVRYLCTLSCMKFICFSQSVANPIASSFRFLIFRAKPFWFQLSYFVSLSFIGFLLLRVLHPKDPLHRPKNLDLFFTSVSAVTVSSMSTVEMEAFSNAQLIVITLLMLVGAEVFTSMLDLQIMKIRFIKPERNENRVDPLSTELGHISTSTVNVDEVVELGLVPAPTQPEPGGLSSAESENLRYRCVRYLGFVVLAYLIVIHVIGSMAILLYVSVISSARDVLKNKGLQKETFAVFTSVSSFANCGFIPTNENMIIFRKNSGLLLLIIPQILVGNTLFPSCLRLVVWVMGRFRKREEVDHILKKPKEIGYDQLLPPLHCLLLFPTVLGFILVQFILFCAMDWHTRALDGMSSYQKVVGILFQSTNTRHAGESVVDISTIASAILVLYVVMMYLPPYTSFLPILDDKKRPRRVGLVNSLIMSQLSYLSFFIILVCITENNKISNDPANFGVLNIVVEVISAYGSVGFSTGYSCQRRLNQDGFCKDASYGFAGKWSNNGKLILILVMLFGRLKKYNMNGGKAWKLR